MAKNKTESKNVFVNLDNGISLNGLKTELSEDKLFEWAEASVGMMFKLHFKSKSDGYTEYPGISDIEASLDALNQFKDAAGNSKFFTKCQSSPDIWAAIDVAAVKQLTFNKSGVWITLGSPHIIPTEDEIEASKAAVAAYLAD
jgi:hypothetical protein